MTYLRQFVLAAIIYNLNAQDFVNLPKEVTGPIYGSDPAIVARIDELKDTNGDSFLEQRIILGWFKCPKEPAWIVNVELGVLGNGLYEQRRLYIVSETNPTVELDEYLSGERTHINYSDNNMLTLICSYDPPSRSGGGMIRFGIVKDNTLTDKMKINTSNPKRLIKLMMSSKNEWLLVEMGEGRENSEIIKATRLFCENDKWSEETLDNSDRSILDSSKEIDIFGGDEIEALP